MKLDLVINSIKWGIAVGLMFLLGVIVTYGGVHVALGVFQGIISYAVLGLVLLVLGSMLLYLLITLILHWIYMEN